MLRVSPPMLVVVLKAWVTEMKETQCASNSSTSLAPRGCGLPRLPSLAERDPDGVRRGACGGGHSPAGLMLDKALEEAGLDRKRAYVTNEVKHFKFVPHGKLRLHKKPNAGEINVCKRWLFSEIDVLKPRLVVALGATAAQSLAGRPVPIGRNRGATLTLANGLRVLVTVHPSSLLRVPDEADRHAAYERFVKDLRAVGALAAESQRIGAP